MSSTPIFVLASANPKADRPDLGQSVRTEMREIRKTLRRHFRNRLEIEFFPGITREELLDLVQDKAYHRRIIGFHFAGHGEDGDLIFQDTADGGEIAYLSGMVRILNRLPNLRFVFLNCCTSEDLALQIAGTTRLVLGSPFLLKTDAAREMAVGFYTQLVSDASRLFDAYDFGLQRLDLHTGGISRGLELIDNTPEPASWEGVWKFYPENSAWLQKIFNEEVRLLELELKGPANQQDSPLNRLMKTGLDIDFITQNDSIKRNRLQPRSQAATGWFLHGAEGYGVDLLRYRVLNHLVPVVGTVIDLRTLVAHISVAYCWEQVGKSLGLGISADQERILDAAYERLSTNTGDAVIVFNHALEHGAQFLSEVLQHFWLVFSQGLELRRTRSDRALTGHYYMFFFAEYEEPGDQDSLLQPVHHYFRQHPQNLHLLQPTGNFTVEDLERFLNLHGDRILKENKRSRIPPGSKSRYFKKAVGLHAICDEGIPFLVLNELCDWTDVNLAELQSRLQHIDRI